MPVELLTVTGLYPNAEMPSHGIFVETRLSEILATGQVGARVVAPVPWFPFSGRQFGRYGGFARVPAVELRRGIEVFHPRFPLLPKVGMALAPGALFLALRRFLRQGHLAGRRIDLIDAHYLYPDAVAAVRLAKWLAVPVVVSARGSDVTQIAEMPGPRKAIQAALRDADAIVTVSESLKRGVMALGLAADKITVLRNGVDLERFRLRPRGAAKGRLGLAGKTALSVGHLIPRKGHDIALRAVARIPDLTLVIAGAGPEEDRLRKLAASLGVAARVRFLGAVPQDELAKLYPAADVLVLASSAEGWANVLLEAMACGTPAVGSAVGGTPEVVGSPAAGRVVAERSPEAFAAALRDLLAAPPSPEEVRRYAEGFGWPQVCRRQAALYRAAVEGFQKSGGFQQGRGAATP